MKKLLPLLLVFVFAAPLVAQTVPPALMVKEDGKSRPLGLTRLETDVRIFGYLAETTSTMTFGNPTDRVMEGDLYFPLPEGATISGYALDIEGNMIDGVAVEKHKGRQVFEKIVRQGIDPGLIEWTKGNNFKTRVFPIPANGSRTIRVRYVTELIGAADGAMSYRLPLNFKSPIADFSLRVEVVKPVAAPKVTKGELTNFSFERWQDSFVAQTKLKDAELNEDLIVALPSVEKQNVVVEKAPDGTIYFAIHDNPAVPERKFAPQMPKHVVVYWDASGSRGAVNHEREIKVLGDCLNRFLPNDKKSTGFTVDLVLIRNAAAPAQRFRWANLNWRKDPGREALLERLRTVDYDGGTQLAALTPDPDALTPDFYMLFSDGISNFGKENPEGLNAPMYVFTADTSANHPYLRQLAAMTGGRYFNLNRLTDSQVVGQLGRAPYSFLAAATSGESAAAICPRFPEPITGRFTLVGQLTEPTAQVTVNYGFDKKNPQRQTFTVREADAVEGTLLRRFWAQKRLAELIVAPKHNEKEIVKLGRQYGLVTPYTSLIVLDSLEQYIEHEIAPPRTLPEMLHKYNLAIDTVEAQQKKQKTEKIDQVVALWNDRVKWWETQFKYPKDFKYKKKKDKKGEDGVADFDSDESFGGEPEMEAPSDEAPEPSVDPVMDVPALRTRDSAPAKIPAGKEGGRQPGILIKPWSPDTPYMKELRKAEGPKQAWAIYMKNRKEYGTSPAYFLDCADFFHGQDNLDLALQVLSNIAEMELDNPALLRVLGHRLTQLRFFDLAILVFERVHDLRPEEPQSYRDLALVLAQRADEIASGQMLAIDPIETLEAIKKSLPDSTPAPTPRPPRGVKFMTIEDTRHLHDMIRADYARSLALLNEVVLGHWDRFNQIEIIALMEANAILPRAKHFGVKVPLDKRLVKLLDCDIRISMTWHADNTDIDLHIIEPSDEEAYYSHNRTTIGGLVSRDFTQGYGPEEYIVRRAMPGVYKIKANFYGSQSTKLLGVVTIQVDIFTNFGRDDQVHKSITRRLKTEKDMITIGEIEF
jgi:tetratricopeptide (TPR) repeat protein